MQSLTSFHQFWKSNCTVWWKTISILALIPCLSKPNLDIQLKFSLGKWKLLSILNVILSIWQRLIELSVELSNSFYITPSVLGAGHSGTLISHSLLQYLRKYLKIRQSLQFLHPISAREMFVLLHKPGLQHCASPPTQMHMGLSTSKTCSGLNRPSEDLKLQILLAHCITQGS